jgi:hypothetical protein
MSLTKTFWRYFLVHQDPAQEAWLEAQARRGLHLARPGLFSFAFVEGEPRQEKYRLDFQMLRGAKRDEYLALFRDAGWEFLGQVANRYYFRARPDAFSPEIFSDVESRKDRIRRQMRIGGAITALLAFQTSMAVTRLLHLFAGEPSSISLTVLLLLTMLTGAFTALGAWCLWQMEQAYKREDRNSVNS